MRKLLQDSMKVARGLSAASRLPRILAAFATAAALGLVARPAAAQSVGQISGTVTNGQPAVSAQVIVVGTRLGAITNAEGRYLIGNVPAGTQTVRAQRIGFTMSQQTVSIIWSGWAKNATTDKTPQQLYIARMDTAWRISSNRVMISAPTASWEVGTELDLEEGPEVVQHGTDTFILYSTRESWLKEYRLGQLRLASAAADPMAPASWRKSGPVFAGSAGVYGVGHASFTLSPNNAEWWVVYHSKVSTTPGWDRDIRMQKFSWGADGAPVFGEPSPSGLAVTRPAGECP